jgi:hypothetical protein
VAHYILETVTTSASTVCDWLGGSGVFMASGTFQNKTLKLHASWDGGTTFVEAPGSELIFTGNDMGAFNLPPCKLKVVVEGGGTAPSIRVAVLPAAMGWVALADLQDTD